DSEEKANQFCNSNINGFLGIDFSNTDIQSLKQINDDSKYKDWIYIFSNCIDNLKSIIPNYKLSNTFERDFFQFDVEVQKSIVDEFKKSKDRNLVTPFYPDTKLIKDVTQDNFDYSILELRVYSPVAIRVYFNELNGFVNLLSIE